MRDGRDRTRRGKARVIHLDLSRAAGRAPFLHSQPHVPEFDDAAVSGVQTDAIVPIAKPSGYGQRCLVVRPGRGDGCPCPKMVESENQHGLSHGDTDAATTGRRNQPGAGVDRSEVEELDRLQRLHANHLTAVLNNEVEAPRRRRPVADRTPIALVDQTLTMPAEVVPREWLGSGIMLVVLGLDDRQVRQIHFANMTQDDVA